VFWKTKAIQAKAHCEDNPSTTSFKDGCLKMIKLSKVIHVHNFGVWNFWKWHVLVVPSIQDYNETCYVSCWKLDFFFKCKIFIQLSMFSNTIQTFS
jgi:hypothetical protein